MAKRQTRRTVSLKGALYKRVIPFAAAHNIPASQLTEQAIEAVLDGRLQLKPKIVYGPPEKPSRQSARQRWRTRRQLPIPQPPAPVVRLVVAPRTIHPAATCACCISPIPASTDRPIMVPWGRDNAMVRICESCSAGGQAAAL